MVKKITRIFEGKKTEFVRQDEYHKNSLFKHHSLFTTKSHIYGGTILIVSDIDWKWLSDPKTTHYGAFGSDYEPINFKYSGHRKWVVIWKFPSDLKYVPGLKPIYNIWLDVGTYYLYDDDWWSPKNIPNANIPINSLVTKERLDIENGSVHRINYNLSNKNFYIACISSTYFIKQFWEVSKYEKKKVIQMLKDLYKVRIYAFPCYGQHHSIIFYYDISKKKTITPKYMAKLLSGKRGKIIEKIITNYTNKKKLIEKWIDNYIEIFT